MHGLREGMGAYAPISRLTAAGKLPGLRSEQDFGAADDSIDRPGLFLAPGGSFRVTIACGSSIQPVEAVGYFMKTRTSASLLACSFLLVVLQLVAFLIGP